MIAFQCCMKSLMIVADIYPRELYVFAAQREGEKKEAHLILHLCGAR